MRISPCLVHSALWMMCSRASLFHLRVRDPRQIFHDANPSILDPVNGLGVQINSNNLLLLLSPSLVAIGIQMHPTEILLPLQSHRSYIIEPVLVMQDN